MCSCPTCFHVCINVFLSSLSEYADLHGRIPEYRVWGLLTDLARVRYMLPVAPECCGDF